MVHLELTELEAAELGRALDVHLVGVRTELARADDREYRTGLRATLETLEQAKRRLDELLRASKGGAGGGRAA